MKSFDPDSVIGMFAEGVEMIHDAVNSLPELEEAPAKKKHSGKLKSLIVKRFDDDYDAIYEAYTNPRKKDRLSPTQKRQLARWKFARQWISEFDPPTESEVVQALRNEYGISARQAYTDVANCKRFFASMDQVNDEFDRIMAVERILRLRNKALQKGDAKSLDVASKCDITLIKLKGWDREKAQMPQPKIVEVVITTDLNILGLQPIENKALAIRSFWLKKEEKKLLEAKTIDFEEILNNPRNERDHAQ
jgi:hypothetical protein